jgi:hypothetical protein
VLGGRSLDISQIQKRLNNFTAWHEWATFKCQHIVTSSQWKGTFLQNDIIVNIHLKIIHKLADKQSHKQFYFHIAIYWVMPIYVSYLKMEAEGFYKMLEIVYD